MIYRFLVSVYLRQKLESFDQLILLVNWEMEPMFDPSGLDSEVSYHFSSIYYFFLNWSNQK